MFWFPSQGELEYSSHLHVPFSVGRYMKEKIIYKYTNAYLVFLVLFHLSVFVIFRTPGVMDSDEEHPETYPVL